MVRLREKWGSESERKEREGERKRASERKNW